jgi:transcription initiation factor TFIIIB Brf1 subunit/transcription initiation factor TFIIB
MALKKRNRYVCVSCGTTCGNENAVYTREELVLNDQGLPEVNRKGRPVTRTITGRGLGTWSCPVHGKTKVRVVREAM